MYQFLSDLPILAAGLILGIIHSFDLDHISAVSTIITKSNDFFKAIRMGTLWGLGHTATLLVIGVIIILFKLSIPEQLSLTFEFIVGVILVLLGLNVIKEILIKKGHFHKHNHNGKPHFHFHYHNKFKSHSHDHAPLYMGIIHGIAGSAALMVLVLYTIQSFWIGILFILIFGFGSIIGMTIACSVIYFSLLISSKFSNINYFINFFIGSFSILLGFHIIIRVVT